MKKKIFIIALIISSILIVGCSNKQTEEPSTNNENAQVSTNTQTPSLTPTPIDNNAIDNDVLEKNEKPFYGHWMIEKTVAFSRVGTYGEEDIKEIIGRTLSFSKEESSCFGDDISYLKETIKNPTYIESTMTSDEFAADFNVSLSAIGIDADTVTEIQINDANNSLVCTFFIKDDNTLILFGGGTFFELSRVTQDTNVDSNLCGENEEVLFSFKVANSNKVASMVISKNQQEYITYRYGTKEEIELEYPIDTENSWDVFTYSYYLRGGGIGNEGLDLNYLSFDNGGYTYQIYEEYSSESDKPSIGIKVTNKETNEVTDIQGDSNSMKGTLISLRDNTKINIISQ